MKLLLLALLAVTWPAALGQPELASGSLDAQDYFYEYHIELPGGEMEVHWTFWETDGDDSDIVEFAMVGPSDGYLALGFGLESNMGGGDFWFGAPGGSTYDAHRAPGDGNGKPSLDDSQDVDGSTEYIDRKVAVRRFRRRLDTGDEDDAVIEDKDMACAWAYGAADSEDYSDFSKHSARDHLTINWFSAEFADNHPFGLTGPQVLLFHAVGMFVAWGVLVPTAVYFAMFMKHIGHAWYTTHLVLQFAAFFIGIFAATLMLLEHADSVSAWPPHGYVGLTATLLLFVQPWIGLYANKVYDAAREKTPVWPDLIHARLGRGAWVLALVNIAFGLLLIGSPLIGVYGVYLVLLGGGFYIRYRNFDPSAEHAAPKDLDTAPYTSL